MNPGFLIGHAASGPSAQHSCGGWFVGHFMETGDLRSSRDVEIKWGIHAAGEKNRGGFVVNQAARSISILIAGHFRLDFRDRENSASVHSVELTQPGQYVLWEAGVEHDWQAITACTLITIRWPSLPGDQSPIR